MHLYSAYNETGDRFAAAFASFREVFLVNLSGAGGSSWSGNPEELSMTAAVKDLEAIRAELGIGRRDFAGHPTGGMLGLQYAVQAQDREPRLPPRSLKAASGPEEQCGAHYGGRGARWSAQVCPAYRDSRSRAVEIRHS